MAEIQSNHLQLIAHRGASSEAPENTLSAIRQAIAIGVDWVEIDIHLTKDNIPIAIHDRFIPGTNRIAVDSLSLQEIKQFDRGSWFGKNFSNEKIPSLQEILAEQFAHSALMIEIKHAKASPKVMANAVLHVLNESPRLPPLKIGSFSLEILQEVKALAPNIPLIGIIERFPMISTFLKKDFIHLAIWYELLTVDVIQILKENNIIIWAFTVDSPIKAKHLVNQGVQGIITNRPRELAYAFKNVQK